MRRPSRVSTLAMLLLVGCGSESDLEQLALRSTAPAVDSASGLTEFRDCPQCPLLVSLPPGRFTMGSALDEEARAGNRPRPEAYIAAEKPQVDIEIGYSIGMGKYEVTFAEWDYCVAEGGCSYRPPDERWGRGDRPVVNVARRDAEEYLAWLRLRTGHAYRLPTEAEWEYAARGGTRTARYWGDALGRGHAVCDGCGSRWDGRRTAPVGSLAANPFGLHDMLGNASEWVADCWNPTLDGMPTDGSARVRESPWWSEGDCERPVQRGGAWTSYPWVARAAFRSHWRPGPWKERSQLDGFRVVREPGYGASVPPP